VFFFGNFKNVVFADNELPHYNQINQMLSNFTKLSEHLIDKSGGLVQTIQDVNSLKADVEHKLSESNSIIQSLEHEIQT
jgi:ABC-type transporter Mla subunit MlaD